MRRLHPLSAALDAVVSGGRLALFAVFASTALAGMGGGDRPVSTAALLVPGAFFVGAGFALARWYRFEYELLPEHLLVRSGVFSRQEREIPLRRVQNVDVRRSLLKRLLGLATVTVETAGGGSTEATLDAVSVADAETLREGLGGRETATDRSDALGEPAGDDPDAIDRGEGAGTAAERGDATATATTGAGSADRETLYELAGRRFAVLCAVSFRPSAVFAPLVGASVFDDLIFDGLRLLVRLGVVDVDVGPGDVPTLGGLDLLPLAAVALAGFLLVVWVVSAALTFVRYYGFRLERVGDELRYERGLLGRYSGNVPLSKVQTVTVSENVAMRRLGYASLTIDTAGYAPGSNGDGGIETAVPLDGRRRVVALADDVRAELGEGVATDRGGPAVSGATGPTGTDAAADTGAVTDGDAADVTATDGRPTDDAFGVGTVEHPPTRARRRYVARYALAALAVTALAVGVDRLVFGLPRFLPLVPLVGVALAPLAGHLTWRHRGHATVGDGFVTRSGVLRRHTRLVPYFRLQTVFVSRSVFQRRRDLASVIADSASSSTLLGGDAIAYDIDDGDADVLREELLDRLRTDLVSRRRDPSGRPSSRSNARGEAGTPTDGTGGADDGDAEVERDASGGGVDDADRGGDER